MKISEAEKLLCPFILHPKILYDDGILPTTSVTNSYCITDKCMAWETTKTKAIQDNFFKCTCGQTFDVYRYDFTCPSCGKEYVNSSLSQELPRKDCEGYCRRLR
jgi:hypothetical protein